MVDKPPNKGPKEVRKVERTVVFICGRCATIYPLAGKCTTCSEVTHTTADGSSVYTESVCLACCDHDKFDAPEPDDDDRADKHKAKLDKLDHQCERGDR